MLKNILLSGVLMFAPIQNADETVVEPPVQETILGEEIVEEEMTEEQFTEKIKEFLGQYLNENVVVEIISWAMNTGLIGVLFTLYIKSRKYKGKSAQEIQELVKQDIPSLVKECFNKMSVEHLQAIYNRMGELEHGMQIMMKALVLAQDKTAEGRIALLNLITEKTNNTEVTKVAEMVKQEIIEETKAEKLIIEKISGDYNPVD